MPDPSTRAIGRKYTVRNTYGIEQWMDQAIIQAAHNTGQTQADVVRACLEYGLAELYLLHSPEKRERARRNESDRLARALPRLPGATSDNPPRTTRPR